MDDCPVPIKQPKLVLDACIICGQEATASALVEPKDANSWQKLCNAAEIRMFDPILKLRKDNPGTVPKAYYHRDCRSKFTHKKELSKLKQVVGDDEQSDGKSRQSLRQGTSETTRVYDRKCIFCECSNKCLKGTSTRETLIQAVDLRADMKLRKVATEKGDTKLLAITSRDIVAAEACYHASCYKKYTVVRTSKPTSTDSKDQKDDYKTAETSALQMLYQFVRVNLFSNPRIVSLVELTSKVVSAMKDEGIKDIQSSTKKHIRRNLECEFGDNLHFFSAGNTNNVYVRPHNLSTDTISRDYLSVKNKIEMYTESHECEQLIVQVALILRDKISQSITEQVWPPHPQELTEKYIEFPDCLVKFLHVLLGGKQNVTSDKVNRLSFSFGQDIISAVTNARVLTPKHILLPWAVKTLTGNVELVRTLNRLGHGCSYTRLQEIDTALCMEKMHNEGGNQSALPSWTHPNIPTVLAFDNIDRQEETLSGAGTSHRVNGIIVQPQTLTCTPVRKPVVDRKEKRRTLDLPEQHLPLYISAKREGPPPLRFSNLSLPQ